MDWIKRLDEWRREFGVRTRAGASEFLLAQCEAKIGDLPTELRELLKISNGLHREWLSVLPIFNSVQPKHTWDDVIRANNPEATRFLTWSPNLLGEFLVFADIGGQKCAAFHRQTGAIWFEDMDEFTETSLSLDGFIETALREVRDL